MHLEWVSLIGVFVVFFNTGLTLPTEDLARGLARWRLHLLVQGFIFGLVPLLMLGLVAARGWLPWGGLLFEGTLGLGFLYLAMLPTTITAANIYTTIAGGNVSGALLNTAAANVAGILLVPLWVVQLLGEVGAERLPLGGLLLQISLLLLLPLLLGQLARPWLRDWATRHKVGLRRLNQGVICLIVFGAFSNSVEAGVWQRYGLETVFAVLLTCASLIAILTALVWLLSGLMRLPTEDRRAALFCAPQKTLAAGVPMASAIFASTNLELGLILLPLMAYHILQLLAHAPLAARIGTK